MIKGTNFNKPNSKPRVLVAPLDWGLGHATRCIPVIFKLLELNCDVIIAAEGAVKILLQKEFPQLNYIELKGYRIKYSRTGYLMPFVLLLQFPKLLFRIYAEKRWLRKMVEEYQIDAVISDNRMGLHHKKIPCVYITHQLQIKTGNRLSEIWAQRIHYHFIDKFNTCWVPDYSAHVNLGGSLSQPTVFPKIPVTYIGTLSRFEKKDIAVKYDLCIILSGPEPQRTVFEKLVTKDLHLVPGNIILIRGLPAEKSILELPGKTVEIVDHLPAAALNLVIQQSKMVLCRSGYSSVMDLVKLQHKAILVPTPGQTEQEYLARHLMKQKLFFCVNQKDLVLQDSLKKATEFPFIKPAIPQNDHGRVIEDFIRSINSAGI